MFYLPKHRDDIDNIGVPITVLINPEVEHLDDDVVSDFEGCLSVPGFRGKVVRSKTIRYTGLNERGEKIDRIASGWHARVVQVFASILLPSLTEDSSKTLQHEVDHLNGILYTTLMAEEDKLLTIEEWKQLAN